MHKLLCWALRFFGVNALYEVFARSRLLLLGYHSISCPQAEEAGAGAIPHLSIPVEHFEKEMRYLQNHGYSFLTFNDLLAVEKGTRALPRRPVIVYFDDGYRDNYLCAYPVLAALNIRAAVFPVAGFIEGSARAWDSGEPYSAAALSWDELRAMGDIFEYGTHTMTHRKLPSLAPDEVRREITESRRLIEARTGRKVLTLSYPKSRFTEEVARIASDEGFAFILSHGRGPHYGESGYKFLSKIPISPNDDLTSFIVKLGVYYPLRSFVRRILAFSAL